MPYIDSNGNKRFTLKEKYQYYKNLAENGINGRGEPVGFVAQVGLANRANSINRRQGRNKKNHTFYNTNFGKKK